MAERPSKQTILAAREETLGALKKVRDRLPLHDPDIDLAWAQIETFCALAMRVMAKTNLSKLRSETLTVEISGRLAGRPVLDPD